MEDSFDFIRKKINIPRKQEGFIWLNMLIKYDLNGNAEVVRSFSKPAKDSTIKMVTKQKPKTEKIEFEKENEKVGLFDK